MSRHSNPNSGQDTLESRSYTCFKRSGEVDCDVLRNTDTEFEFSCPLDDSILPRTGDSPFWSELLIGEREGEQLGGNWVVDTTDDGGVSEHLADDTLCRPGDEVDIGHGIAAPA